MKRLARASARGTGSAFQYPQPRVYAMKRQEAGPMVHTVKIFQYPQPRVYAMKRLPR